MAHPKVNLKIRKLAHFKGDLPRYESPGASGFDVRAQVPEVLVIQPGARALVPTGLCFEVPDGYELQARPRSGLAVRSGVGFVNSPGTIDADYRGEIKFVVINWGTEPLTVQDQDRIGQLILCPVVQADFEISDEISATARGDNGFGSTGLGRA